MQDGDIGLILAAIARVEEQVKSLSRDDERATKRIDAHGTRLDKLERIAYIALGIAVASGAPQVAALIH